jgi:hypothetical protein
MDYPSKADLTTIHKWPILQDPWGLLDHLIECWTSYGNIIVNGRKVIMTTGGWSGNESLIYALQETMWWQLYWQKSERGGLHEFRLPERKKK